MSKGSALYRIIYQTIRSEIEEGMYAPGSRLPTEMELAQRFYVSRITSKRALNLLAEDGLVVRIAGRGTFVKKDCPVPALVGTGSANARTIALVMGGYAAAFGLDVMNGAVQRAQELGLHLIVQDTNNNQDEETKILRSLRSGNAQGIIFQPAHGEMYNEIILDAQLQRYPMVMIDRMMNGIGIPYIGLDNVNAGYQLTSRLIGMGHRNISLAALEGATSSSLRERMDGCMAACEEHNIPVTRDLWVTHIKERITPKPQDKNAPCFAQRLTDYIARHLQAHPQITAVFATEYMVAQGVMNAAHQLGLTLGKDLSLVSVDCPLDAHAHLAHLRQPQKQLGASAVDTLLHLIQRDQAPPARTLLKGEWVDGSSLGPAPHSTAQSVQEQEVAACS